MGTDKRILTKAIQKAIIRNTEEGYDCGQEIKDLLNLAKALLIEDEKAGREVVVWLADYCEEQIPVLVNDGYYDDARKMIDLQKQILLCGSPYVLDHFIQYIEWERDVEKRFYLPRRKVLKQVVDALQALADGDLELLTISMPPGVGKTTIAIFFLIWMAGKYPEEPMLTGSHSNAFIRGVYDECLRMFDPHGEYLWNDVFPHLSVSNTNAKDCRIDIGTRKRFETLEFTSIGTGNAGLYRASSLLYCDDLVSGLEVALSKDRLDKLWSTYTTDLRQRKIGDHCRELHIATRWSVHDIIGRLENEYGDDPKAKFIVLSALDENDESNFDYPYGVGFSTKTYHKQREIMDDASWRALYMNEPIEREGLVFPEYELRRYFELPAEAPDSIIAVCDTKDKGKDYCFLPVVYVYGQNYYIEDCVCDNSMPEYVEAKLVDALFRHKVKLARFESNSAGGRIAKDVHNALKKRGGFTDITTKFTSSNKETKILSNAGWVKQHCLFKDESLYRPKSDYGKMMNMLCSYTQVGKNAHDDVPDGMAQLAELAQSMSSASVTIFQRPF